MRRTFVQPHHSKERVWRSRQWHGQQNHTKIQRNLKSAPPTLRVSLSAAPQERCPARCNSATHTQRVLCLSLHQLGAGGSPHEVNLHFQQQQPFPFPRLRRDKGLLLQQQVADSLLMVSGSRQELICN